MGPWALEMYESAKGVWPCSNQGIPRRCFKCTYLVVQDSTVMALSLCSSQNKRLTSLHPGLDLRYASHSLARQSAMNNLSSLCSMAIPPTNASALPCLLAGGKLTETTLRWNSTRVVCSCLCLGRLTCHPRQKPGLGAAGLNDIVKAMSDIH